MRNWILILIALAIVFIGVTTKKLFFLLFIVPLSMFSRFKSSCACLTFLNVTSFPCCLFFPSLAWRYVFGRSLSSVFSLFYQIFVCPSGEVLFLIWVMGDCWRGAHLERSPTGRPQPERSC